MQKELSIQVLDNKDIKSSELESFAYEVLTGLSRRPKSLPSKYFYDDEGSRLFQKITSLDEYYLTRAEHSIFASQRGSILSQTGFRSMNLIELGAGDGHKTFLLIEELLNQSTPFHYYPIDISKGAMESLLLGIQDRFSGISVDGLVSDYFKGLQWINQHDSKQNLVLFLGSNIGNFSNEQAHAFLIKLWQVLNPGDMVLIGFDLKKDVDLMTRAYSDSKGVTSSFNLNLLQRINRELNADFDLNTFTHHAFYNPLKGAMESYLLSKIEQSVEIKHLGRNIEFHEFEPIHTEYSYKYTHRDIESLAANAGFSIENNYSDKDGYFVDSLWRVLK